MPSEVAIRSWVRQNGTWDVTVHSDSNGTTPLLHDVPKMFRKGMTREKAEEYVVRRLKEFAMKGDRITVEFPDAFGQESPTEFLPGTGEHGWQYYGGKDRWGLYFEDGKLEAWLPDV